MSDAFEHNPGDHEDPMSGPTWLIGFIGTIILIVIVLAVTALLKFTETDAQEQLLVAPDLAELVEIRSRDTARLSGEPRVVEFLDVQGNRSTRLVIPIEEAVQHVADEFSGTGPQAASDLDTVES